MMSADSDLEELVRDFFASEVDPDLVAAVESSRAWPDALWRRLAATDLPWVGIPETAGGAGGSLADAAALVKHAAYHATPLPLLEHHVAAHLVATTGLAHREGRLTVAGLGGSPPAVAAGRISGRLGSVAWADSVEAVVVVARGESGADVVAVVDEGHGAVEPGRDLAGTPTSTLVLDDIPVEAALLPDLAHVRRRAEVLRASLLTGLLQRLSDLTAGYVAERHQFGRPIGSFQAVQIHVVTLAQAASMATVAVDRAVSAVANGAGALEVDATVVVVDALATQAAAAAHQAHGAIGMTREYPLQQVTRRIHAWRQPWRPAVVVAESLGRIAGAAPSFARLYARHPEEELTIT